MPATQPSTLVIVRAPDHNGAFASLDRFITEYRAAGGNVVVIGDGERTLNLGEVSESMRAVSGPATLFIAAHGGRGIPVSNHFVDGITPGRILPGKIEFMDDRLLLTTTGFLASGEFFSQVPANYHTVIMDSCYSGAANDDAVRHLPQGTLFLPLSTATDVSYGGDFLLRSQLKPQLDQPTYASDLYLASILNGHREDRMGYVSTAPGLSLDRTLTEAMSDNSREMYAIQRRNIPDRIAIGGVGNIDLGNYLKRLEGYHFSDATLLHLGERLANALNGNLPAAESTNLGNASFNGNEVDQIIFNNMEFLRPIAESITAGTMTEDAPDYRYAIALAYAVAESSQGLLAPRNEQSLIVVPPTDTRTGGLLYIENGSPRLLQSKYERELIGLSIELNTQNAARLRHPDGSSKLDLDGDNYVSAEELGEILRATGVARSEQIGDGNREITLNEFLEHFGGADLPNVPKLNRPDRGHEPS